MKHAAVASCLVAVAVACAAEDTKGPTVAPSNGQPSEPTGGPPAVVLPAGGAPTSDAGESPALSEARGLIDRETAVLTSVVADPSAKDRLEKTASSLASSELGTDPGAEIKRRQSVMARLSEADRATLRAYAQSRTANLKAQLPPVAAVLADSRGDRVKQWCNFYHGRTNEEHLCTGVVDWCWDDCILPDTSKKYFEGPYPCGACFIIHF
jgi:hypothetical protein